MATRSMDLATWAMPRRRSDAELDGIPPTAPGAGLRVSRKRRKTRLMGMTALGEAPPRAIEDVDQRVFLEELPTICGKCSSPNVVWQPEPGVEGRSRRVHCYVCGWDAFFVIASRITVPVLTVPVERGRGVDDLRVEDVIVEDVVPKLRSRRMIQS